MTVATSPQDGPGLPVIVIAGPTASGKSAAAEAAAREFGGTVINADSVQVYRDLRVLSARPDTAAEQRVPHRLYGVVDAAERCSAGRWLGMASAAVADARREGRLPVIVGGSGLYLRALLRGLAPIPAVPAATEAAVQALYAELGGNGFRDRLALLDPEAAIRIPASDPQRLQRAYAVAEATGRPLSAWQATHKAQPAVPGVIAGFAFLPPRDELYRAIDQRFDAMLAAGALEEVRTLADRKLSPDLPAMKALGVPQLLAVIRGELPLEEARIRAQQMSRRYAKRQMTWLRHQSPELDPWNEQYSERLDQKIFSFIRNFY